MVITGADISTVMTMGSIITIVLNILSQHNPGWFYTNVYPPDRSELVRDSTDRVFDFIVVGGGSAGAVVASRLSEMHNCTVLLIEAGKNPSPESDIPGAAMETHRGEENWDYSVEPQAGACLGARNKICKWAKGKALGGSSVINAMMYIVGNKRDFDDWEAAGNPGWGSDDVLYYFKKSQEMQPDYIAKYGTKDFGDHGPLRLRKWNSTLGPLQDIVLEGTEALGHPTLEAFTMHDQMGFGKLHGTIDTGKRMNTAITYLAPARDRDNLVVLTETMANRIIIEGNVATGVEMTLANGQSLVARATKEVILCAGSIATPQLLMLSGIGPAEELLEFDIDVVADLPVGKNLQDHLMWLGVILSHANDSRPTQDEQLASDINDYTTNQDGFLAQLNGIDCTGFINVNDPKSDVPNIQYIIPFFRRNTSMVLDSITRAYNLNDEISSGLVAQNNINDTIVMSAVLLHPRSTGEVRLRSTDPRDHPLIFANYLTHPDDVNTMLKSVDFVRNLTKTDAFRDRGVYLQPALISGCEVYDFDTQDYWECNLRHTAATVWHPVGTTRMGPSYDSSTVVDPQLRVHGFSNIRVADASIMPTLTSGNTNAPAIMIGEKASDLIKETWAQ